MAEQRAARAMNPARRRLLAELLRKEGIELPAGPGAPAAKVQATPSLSFAQERLWFLDQLDPGNAAYNIARALRLKGRLDLRILARACAEVIRRHEILRAAYPCGDDGPVLRIGAPSKPDLALTDLSGLAQGRWRREMSRLLAEKSRVRFVLERGPLIQAHVIKLGATDHLLLLVLHQMVCDGWSMNLLLHELAALYRSAIGVDAAPLPDLKIQYSDYAAGQRARLGKSALEAQLEFWRKTLKNSSSGIAFATDRPRPAVQSFRGARLHFVVPAALFRRVQRLGRDARSTPFVVLMAAFNALLWRYTAQEDIAVGFPAANRDSAVAELIGPLVNTLVLRTDLSGHPTFRELLERVNESCRAALAHQDLPFDRLVEDLQRERDLSRNPLFQVMFGYQNYPAATFAVPGLKVVPVDVAATTSKFDLSLSLTEDGPVLRGFIEYATDLFDRPTVARMARHFLTLVRGSTAAPDGQLATLPLLSKPERHRILVQWNDAGAGYPKNFCLHQLFEGQARRTPRAVAVECGGERLTYGELNRRANRLARFLVKRGAGPEKLVGVCLGRSLEMVIALLAILKAGAAYLALDPRYPPRRVAFMLEDAQAAILLTRAELAGGKKSPLRGLERFVRKTQVVYLERSRKALEKQRATDLSRGVRPGNLAYVIYTSGSTGEPKGVGIEHGNAVAFLHWAGRIFSRAELAGVAASTSLCFDLSVFELFAPLCRGGKVILLEDALDLARGGAREDITLVNTVPSAITEVLGAGGLPRSLRTVNLAGELLPSELVAKLYALKNVKKVYDLYGPSETTTYSTFALRRPGARPTIGRPIANSRIYILDPAVQPVPPGAPGELYIGGAGVARGYLRRPELTAQKFLPDPFARRSGARMYRTGDLARYPANGDIEYLGRVDNQVKIRGYRIEPGEIEAALAAHPAIRESAVIARDRPADAPPSVHQNSKIDHPQAEKQLLAYLVFEKGRTSSIPELRHFLRTKLPEFMVPSIFIPLNALPLTPNGKVDRLALPAAADERGRTPAAIVAPRTESEEMVAQVWREVLGVARIGAFDDFFDLGGHSLLAIRVVARLRRIFDVELPLRALFEIRSVAGLAQKVEALRGERRGIRLPEIVPARRARPVALSFAQRRLWYLVQLEPELTAYNIPTAHRIRGPLNRDFFKQALDRVIERHSVLRSAIVEVDGEPMQRIMPQARLSLPVIDLTALSARQAERAIARCWNKDAERPFALDTAPLLRGKILRLGDEDHVLLLNFHHIVCDGSSLAVFYRELAVFYEALCRGREGALARLPAQYADYAAWQWRLLEQGGLEPQLAYWRRQLAGLAPMELPTDGDRPALPGYRGAKVSRRLSRELSAALRQLGRREHATLFMVLLAALKILLARLSATSDIVVGSTIAGRSRPELEGLIGFFINSLALRTDVSGNPPFVELLARVRETCLDAFTHQDLPFERIVEELHPQRDPGRNPIFQVLFNMADISERQLRLSGCTAVKLERAAPGAKFELVVHAPEIDGCIELALVYNAALFGAPRARAMLDQWSHLLSQIAGDPGQAVDGLSLVAPPAEALLPNPRARLDDSWRGPIHSWVARQAQMRAKKAAVFDERESWSYDELDRTSNRLARYFLRRGIRPRQVVAIYAHRDASLALVLLGILKAGAAFVILDPAYPPARLIDYLRGARPVGLLEMAGAAELPAEVQDYVNAAGAARMRLPRAKDAILRGLARCGTAPPKIAVAADDPAYIAFTSGSTGQPKGVLCRHGPITHFVPWQGKAFGLRVADRYGLLSGLGYNHLHRDLFTALASGATLGVPSEQVLKEPQQLARWLGQHKISVLHLTPALGRLLHTSGVNLPSVRRIFFGGDLLLRQDVLAMRELAPNAGIVSFYGATETQRAVGYFVVPDALLRSQDGAPRVIPTGKGAPGVQLLLLAAGGRLAGIGEVGELYIRSPHLARGYVDEDGLNETTFVANPFADDRRDRMYRTRELGRYLPDGNVEWLGRNDRRASIRGYRVELAEVETALGRCPGVRQAAVVAENVGEAAGAEARLIAHVERAEQSAVEAGALRDFLKTKLPHYMIPAEIHFIERMPINPNGKIDYAGLARSPRHSSDEIVWEAPANDLERAVAKIFAEALRLERIGRRDNFFERGGHSLLAAKAAARVRQTFGAGLDLRMFLESPTVEAICARIEAGGAGGGGHASAPSLEREEIEL